jgi:hypothetical protein
MKINLLVVFILASFSLYAQEMMPTAFHRSYPMERDTFNQVFGSVDYDGTTVVFTGLSKNDSVYAIIATALEPKGDVIWSNELVFDEGIKFRINKFEFSTFSIKEDSIYFAFNFDQNNNRNKVFGKLSVNGRFGEVTQIKADSTPEGNTLGANKIVHYTGNVFYQLSNLGVDSLIYLNTLRTDGTVVRSNRIRSAGQNLIARDLALNNTKTNLAILGSNPSYNNYFIGLVDTLGRVLSGKTFQDTIATVRQLIPKRIIATKDNGYIVIGRYFNINPNDVNDSFFGSFISKHDTLTNLVWTRYIDVSAQFPVVLDDVVESTNDAIIVAGNYTDSLTNDVVPFSIGFTTFGAPFYTKKFPRVEGIRDYPGSLLKFEDGGVAYSSSITKTKKNEEPIFSFIRISDMGSAMCEDEINHSIVFDLPMKKDTLILISGVSQDVTTQRIKTRTKSNTFDVPILTLESKTFCPNEPIILTLRATTEGAVAYEWSTGATTDTIVVMEEGEYSVIVSINTNECYTICDTSNISVYEKPEVELLQQDGNFCTNGLMTVRANILPTAPIRSIVWNTGQRDTNRIEIVSGNAAIVVTDECDQVVSASINVVPLRLINNVTITQDFGSFCGTRTGRLTANADASVSGYNWGNNRFTPSIEISNPGTYSVTVFDVCRNQKLANITVTDANIPKIVERVDIFIDPTDVCKDDMVGLQAVVVGEAKSFTWSNGSTGDRIKVPNSFGSITVTAVDDCGNKTSTTEVEDVDPVCFKLAKIFFPDSNNSQDSTTNRTFKAISVGCPTAGISDFEFRVFNRWGKEVFGTTSITGEWDGTIGGEKAQPDVYVYFIRYRQNDCTLDRKGDVTLLR